MKTKNNYVIVRTYSAGVFAGNLIQRKGKEVQLENARRIWYWKGANSLSDLALNGVDCPDECKFSPPISVTLTEAIEIITVSEKAKKNISGVKLWQRE